MENRKEGRLVACHRFQMPDGATVTMSVAVLDSENRVVSFRKMDGEEPYVEWYQGTLRVAPDGTVLDI